MHDDEACTAATDEGVRDVSGDDDDTGIRKRDPKGPEKNPNAAPRPRRGLRRGDHDEEPDSDTDGRLGEGPEYDQQGVGWKVGWKTRTGE